MPKKKKAVPAKYKRSGSVVTREDGRHEEFKVADTEPIKPAANGKPQNGAGLRDWADFMHDGWRVFKIMAEFVTGFETMAEVGPAATIFGSARVTPGDKYYKLAEEMAELLVKNGLGVITGGGPGIMEAANKGAKKAGGASIGFNIFLPHEQESNRYIDRDKLITFNYFFVRKVMFVKYSQAFIALPGGYGTLDELSEAITLIQTKKITMFPVILIGKEYWKGFMKWVRKTMMAEYGYIGENDLDYVHLVDSPEDAIKVIKQFYPDRKYTTNF